ncbi:MAG: hypothetical protein OXJ62_02765, partial [Spirochaetaceae bacterium]|nr:hypothetical protein [Spirochaetaceae bacterium]
VDWLRRHGAQPFIVPAMGSHGGATAEGQREVLAGWGITSDSMGVPVRATMAAVELGAAGDPPVRVFMDRNAHQADAVLVVNRVKPHTDFHGPVESGLIKMAVIGLGKQRGAEAIHFHGVYGLAHLIRPAFDVVRASGKLLGGVALVEDGREQTAAVRAARAADIPACEARCLAQARRNLAALPLDEIDVLVLDEIGKEISGTGMDTNVVGRIGIAGVAEPASPRVRRIVVLGLTEASHGNALGIGLADVTTRRFAQQVDHAVTNANVITSTFLERGRMPLVAADDAEALRWAVQTCGAAVQDAAVVRVRNTLALESLLLSRPAAHRARAAGAVLMQDSDYEPACPSDGRIVRWRA